MGDCSVIGTVAQPSVLGFTVQAAVLNIVFLIIVSTIDRYKNCMIDNLVSCNTVPMIDFMLLGNTSPVQGHAVFFPLEPHLALPANWYKKVADVHSSSGGTRVQGREQELLEELGTACLPFLSCKKVMPNIRSGPGLDDSANNGAIWAGGAGGGVLWAAATEAVEVQN